MIMLVMMLNNSDDANNNDNDNDDNDNNDNATTTTREQSSRGPVDEMHFFKKSCSRPRPKLCNSPHYVNTWSSTCHNKPRKLLGINTLCEHLVSYMSQ